MLDGPPLCVVRVNHLNDLDAHLCSIDLHYRIRRIGPSLRPTHLAAITPQAIQEPFDDGEFQILLLLGEWLHDHVRASATCSEDDGC